MQPWFTVYVLSTVDIHCYEETELRKADRTVGVNCNIFSNISSGTARLLQGMFTTEKRRYNLNDQDKVILYRLLSWSFKL